MSSSFLPCQHGGHLYALVHTRSPVGRSLSLASFHAFGSSHAFWPADHNITAFLLPANHMMAVQLDPSSLSVGRLFSFPLLDLLDPHPCHEPVPSSAGLNRPQLHPAPTSVVPFFRRHPRVVSYVVSQLSVNSSRLCLTSSRQGRTSHSSCRGTLYHPHETDFHGTGPSLSHPLLNSATPM